MSENVLVCKNISKSFNLKGGKSNRVLDNVTFAAPLSSFTAIIGKSGLGKTTLLNIMSGITKPDSGLLEINGKNLFGLNERERSNFRLKNFGMVFQDDNLSESFTVYENIILPLMCLGIKSDKKEVSLLCEELGVEMFFDRFPSALSGGQKQRATLARALLIKPLIIFADEPTGSLDAASEDEVLNILQRIHAERKLTVIAVTHSEKLIMRAERIINLQEINNLDVH